MSPTLGPDGAALEELNVRQYTLAYGKGHDRNKLDLIWNPLCLLQNIFGQNWQTQRAASDMYPGLVRDEK